MSDAAPKPHPLPARSARFGSAAIFPFFVTRNRNGTPDGRKDIKGISRSVRRWGGRAVRSASIACDSSRLFFLRLVFCSAAATTGLLAGALATRDAAAEGDTRSLTFLHTHTRETATITYRRNGRYDEQALEQLNWLLRDWRVGEPAKMDPRLFDILWEVYREAGSREPINVISAYRSPATNGMLRRRSSGVSEHSQHMRGKAMDIRLPDVETGRLRAIAMRMQYGGVGYYPSSQFVHVDTGNVRAWPRMSQDQLVRLFPDGKTLHLPSSGKPLARYDEAKAEILQRNAALAAQASAGGGSFGSIMTALFGRKAPTQNAASDQEPAKAAPIQLASAEPDVVALPPPPLPPQRPKDLLAAPEAVEPAPAEPATAALVTAQLSPPEPVLGFDEQAAVRALFDPRTLAASVGFAPGRASELNAKSFSGPAVKPLPLVRQAQLDL
jgi:uncharacterized protein YcbK (DUF882 family)